MSLRSASSMVFLAVCLDENSPASKKKTSRGWKPVAKGDNLNCIQFGSETLHFQVAQSLQVNFFFEIYKL